ncbi:hypothetical protein [Nitrosococcus oceani]|uniref:hypothetical protein n=1 Tax=Nitrosococcus oceani TaxID=1229 RepID=UPI000AC0FD05|nr:hypothetical protein [Nitrosococcus oceani]
MLGFSFKRVCWIAILRLLYRIAITLAPVAMLGHILCTALAAALDDVAPGGGLLAME